MRAGSQSAPVQLAGWTFCQGLDCVGGDVAWAWQHAGCPMRLAMVATELDGACCHVAASLPAVSSLPG